MSSDAHLYASNAVYLEQLYDAYKNAPESVDEHWRDFFTNFPVEANEETAKTTLKIIGGTPEEDGAPPAKKGVEPQQSGIDPAAIEQVCTDSLRGLMLIRAYKTRGHLLAQLDPLRLAGNIGHPDLDPATYGFTEADYDREIFLGEAFNTPRIKLGELVRLLQKEYSGAIGVEFMHIPSLQEREWVAGKMEDIGRFSFSAEEKTSILKDIIQVQEFEEFLHKRFPGQKRFSVEGGESVIAAMEKVIEAAALDGVKEVVIGMAHRGRLNVLTKVMGKPYAALIAEFKGGQTHFGEDVDATGDVKYHQGVSSDREFNGNKIHLSLSANPSHLEAVNPVAEGRCRAKQDQYNDTHRRSSVLPLLIHGDAAFAGQGVVAETLALSDLDGYTTGGTVHIIINNQIGFTTNPNNARKSPYPSDIAKGIHAPIFHVNGDDPEAVVYVSKLALEYRQKFGKDVVVDVMCYRRYGHNEGDEPFFTQPRMYAAITKHKTPKDVYSEALIRQGVLSQGDYDAMKKEVYDGFSEAFDASEDFKPLQTDRFGGFWSDLKTPDEQEIFAPCDTGLSEADFARLAERLYTVPDDINMHRKLKKRFEQFKDAADNGKGIDWALGEGLAFASLLDEQTNVRVSGQDSVRGTFSHRHSAIIDQLNERRYFPLKNIADEQGTFEVIDSNLSEFAVLGFEYGYSLADPSSLVIWEAQFGDFCNGAQIIFDQFISSAEVKWLRSSGLVMLLPHGYEGQGPEHSSARLERFLQLCAENNMQVVNCTAPANFFHALRRQMHRDFRKPLVVMSPKSLLRHKECVSNKEDFLKGSHFRELITDPLFDDAKAKKARKVVLCSGKIYYELAAARAEKKAEESVAIMRLEQLYPFHAAAVTEALAPFKNAEFVWCQEEPKNMGSWHFIDRRLEDALRNAGVINTRPVYAGRPEAASPAAGYPRIHNNRQKSVVEDALS